MVHQSVANNVMKRPRTKRIFITWIFNRLIAQVHVTNLSIAWISKSPFFHKILQATERGQAVVASLKPFKAQFKLNKLIARAVGVGVGVGVARTCSEGLIDFFPCTSFLVNLLTIWFGDFSQFRMVMNSL